MTTDRISAPRSEGVGLKLPVRDPDHADPEWYQRDLDELESNDPVGEDPLPTERHRTVPS
jgi:hypothetical protein